MLGLPQGKDKMRHPAPSRLGPTTRPGSPSGPSGAGILVGRGLGRTEGRTIRVGLPGRTATDEMVDRLLAVLSG
jgi:hypothetical protein